MLLPPERRIEFRVGIHLGDVVEESDGDLMGDGVNIAERLEGTAAPGAICLSEDAYRQVKGRLDLAVTDLGPTLLKNIADPVRVYSLEVGKPAPGKAASDTKPPEKPDRGLIVNGRFLAAAVAGLILLLAAGSWLFWRHPRPSLLANSSVAVLPFAILAGDEATGRLADGLTENSCAVRVMPRWANPRRQRPPSRMRSRISRTRPSRASPGPWTGATRIESD